MNDSMSPNLDNNKEINFNIAIIQTPNDIILRTDKVLKIVDMTRYFNVETFPYNR